MTWLAGQRRRPPAGMPRQSPTRLKLLVLLPLTMGLLVAATGFFAAGMSRRVHMMHGVFTEETGRLLRQLDVQLLMVAVIAALLAFGIAFEVPVATVILSLAGILSPEAMAAKRSYIIVGAFVIGMLLMPDVISQTLLAVPMWLLFEVGIFISRLLLRRRNQARATAAAESTGQR